MIADSPSLSKQVSSRTLIGGGGDVEAARILWRRKPSQLTTANVLRGTIIMATELQTSAIPLAISGYGASCSLSFRDVGAIGAISMVGN